MSVSLPKIAEQEVSWSREIAESAFVGKDVEFKGRIKYEGTLRIEGRIEGEIQTSGELRVGKEAVIVADIQAGTVISEGRISGQVIAERKVQLLAQARVDGPLQTPSLTIEEGVLLNGSVQMGGT